MTQDTSEWTKECEQKDICPIVVKLKARITMLETEIIEKDEQDMFLEKEEQ